MTLTYNRPREEIRSLSYLALKPNAFVVRPEQSRSRPAPAPLIRPSVRVVLFSGGAD